MKNYTQQRSSDRYGVVANEVSSGTEIFKQETDSQYLTPLSTTIFVK